MTRIRKEGQIAQPSQGPLPDSADAHNQLGSAYDKGGQVDLAMVQYREAVRLKPDHSGVRHNLGNALAQKGQMDNAIREFEAALRLDPGFIFAQKNLAQALAIRGAPPGR
jgi:Tfp pilus assembly protein PilF